MTIVGGIVTFSVVWWLVFFMALPIGVRPQADPVPGSERGAPEHPRLLVKAVATTIVAVLVTAAIAWFIDQEFVTLRPAAS